MPLILPKPFFRSFILCWLLLPLLYSTEASAQWSTATLSVARDELTAATVGTKVFFAGGTNGATHFNTVDIYNNSTNIWSTATLSQARSYLAAAAVGNKVLFGGGENNTGYSNVVDIYDNSTNSWSATTLPLQARYQLVATTVGSKVFFAGGYGTGGYSDDVDIYDNSTNTWSTAALSVPRTNLTAASVGNKVLFAGGQGNSGYSNVVDIYDYVTNIWTTATLSQARQFLSATTVGNKIFFAGGSNGALSNVVDIYDNSSNTWSTTTLSQARASLVAVTLGSKAFFGGGYSGNVVDIYNGISNSWSTATLSQARSVLAATAVGTKVFFGGGVSSGGYSNVVDIYDSCVTPTAFNVTGTGSYCSGGSGLSIGLGNSQTGVTYQLYNGAALIGAAISGTGASITFGNQTAAGTYTVIATRTIGSCTNTMTGSATVTISPTPNAVATPNSATICSGSSTSIALTGNVPGTIFSWTVAQSGVSGASPGSGTGITQQLTTTGTTAGTATYTITPAYTNAGITCTGTAITVIIVVNPTPTANATNSLPTLCSGSSTSVALTGTVTGTTFAWTVAQSGVSGASAASGTGITQQLNTTGTAAGTATYTITPTYANAGKTCTGTVITAPVIVNPVPTANAMNSSPTICSGSSTSITLTGTVPGTIFAWTVAQSGVSGASAASGTSITQQLTATSAANGTATYSITPTFINNGVTCAGSLATASVTVMPNNTIVLTSAAGTNAQTTCINTAITSVTYATTGATNATFSGLPTGVTGLWAANVATISGTPGVSGTFPYTVTLTGGCGSITATGTITVTPNGTIILASAAGSNNQTVCINTQINNIIYAVGGSGINGSVTGLPAGVTGSVVSGVVVISGAPTVSGTFTYTVNTAGPCINPTAAGTLTVMPNNTATMTSAAGTNSQVVCVNNPIANITYATTGATNATFSGLPTGVAGSWAGNVATISGTPTVSGTFNYTVTPTGGCGTVTTTGTITVVTSNTIALTSAVGTNAQTVCINTPIVNVTYATAGATGATFSGLPTGVTGSWAANAAAINGTPASAGIFTYTVTLTGGCGTGTATGTITVVTNNTIGLTSAGGTNAQAVCINTPITSVTYATTGAIGATFSGLPAGITGSWAANVATISGTPTASGAFNYTVTLTGGCGTVIATGTITVLPNNTIGLTSAVGTNAQTVCINNAVTGIVYTTTGATGATFSGLPAGVTGLWVANVATISGTPTVSGTFNYTVTPTGGCGTVTATGTITAQPDATVILTSAAGTNAQTVCVNTPITNIIYAVGGSGTGGSVSGLPAGITGIFTSGVIIISGTPSASGAFNYTVSTTGPCVTPIATGTLTVTPNNTITLTSAAGTNAQTSCINTPVTAIIYATTGVTGATFSGLPAGVTGSWAGNVATISGTPTGSGTTSYTITLTGGCGTVTATGTITVLPTNTIALASAVGTNAQTLCINNAVTAITYATTVATGATFSGLPAGVTGSWAANVATISGIPTASGTFNYTVTLTGGCGTIAATGIITVITNNTIALTSATGTNNAQAICINSPITDITYATTGATGAIVTGLPAGLTGSWSANVVTISGTPALAGAFTYTVTLIGGCGTVTAIGTITVLPTNTVTLTSAAGTNTQAICINTPITNITYATTGATGATITGLPAGVTGSWAANVITISGTPVAAGTSNYTITLSGGCGTIAANGTITVVTNNTIALTAAAGTDSQAVCINSPIANITYVATGATGATVTGLPAGVTGSWAANVVTISGTPTVLSGSFNYTVSLTGGCGTAITAKGTITIITNNTIALASAAGTDSQAVCINNPITNITYATTGATGATVTGLPVGVTGSWAANMVTISGTPATLGTFTYTITLTGGCGTTAITKTGTIRMITNNTITLTSATGTNAQAVCINSPITNITYATTGATGATVTGLPAGVAGSWAANVVTISGTPTVSGAFNVTLTGGCGTAVTATGTIAVKPSPTVTPANNSPIICSGDKTSIALTGTGTSFSWTVVQSGISGASADSGTSIAQQLTATDTIAGTATYTITPKANDCLGSPITVTVLVNPTPNASVSPDAQTICSGAAIIPIRLIGAVSGTTSNWTRDNAGTVAGTIRDSGTGNVISGSLTNTTNVPVTVTFTIIPTANSCAGREIKARVLVNTNPAKLDLTGLNLNNNILCKGAENISFNVISPVSGNTYLWSSNPSNVSIKDTGGPNTAITFPDTGTYDIKVVATNGYGCTDSAVQKVVVRPAPGIATRQIFLKQPGNTLIYADNSLNPGDGYQWGYDSLLRVNPRAYSPGIPLPGQVYQLFTPESRFLTSNNMLDTAARAFWVLLRKGACFSRVYYNGPYSPRRMAPAPPEDNTVRLSVMPNPNNGYFNISLAGNIYGDAHAVIYNALGQAVFNADFTKAVAVVAQQFNTGHLPDGLYYIQITSSDLKKAQTRFIIQH